MTKSLTNIIVLSGTPKHRFQIIDSISDLLNIPICSTNHKIKSLALIATEERLELRTHDSNYGPVFVDFVGGKNAHRIRYGGGRGQSLVRACGFKPNFNPIILDGTAGFGRDTWVLASMGSFIHTYERNPIIAALLQDALTRAMNNELTYKTASRIKLLNEDFRSNSLLHNNIDTVYLDPMFPARTKTAAIKKDMFLIQSLVGHEEEDLSLLKTAQLIANKRVVVKRPVNADHYSSLKPHASVKDKTIRFDLYIPN